MHVDIAEAQAKLSKLIAAAERGEEIFLTRGDHAVAPPSQAIGARCRAAQWMHCVKQPGQQLKGPDFDR